MASIFVMVRGPRHRVEKWKNEIEAQYFRYTYKNPITNNVEQGLLSTIYRPWELGEIVVPNDAVPEMLATLQRDKPWHKAIKWLINPLRAFLKLKQIPQVPKEMMGRPIYHGLIEVVPVGV